MIQFIATSVKGMLADIALSLCGSDSERELNLAADACADSAFAFSGDSGLIFASVAYPLCIEAADTITVRKGEWRFENAFSCNCMSHDSSGAISIEGLFDFEKLNRLFTFRKHLECFFSVGTSVCRRAVGIVCKAVKRICRKTDAVCGRYICIRKQQFNL